MFNITFFIGVFDDIVGLVFHNFCLTYVLELFIKLIPLVPPLKLLLGLTICPLCPITYWSSNPLSPCGPGGPGRTCQDLVSQLTPLAPGGPVILLDLVDQVGLAFLFYYSVIFSIIIILIKFNMLTKFY